ncbi:MAG: agmatine deiminase [Ilumatobacteraceae bacterium]|nr:agmatine deiminase [Ilumatobacteraceae bacterium]
MTLRMPAEFGPHERTVLCWPAREALYGEMMPMAEDAHAQVARVIAEYEPVSMIVQPGPAAARAAELCGGRVEIVEIPIDDSWFRDSGPIYVTDTSGSGGDQRVATDWTFNSWGRKYGPWDQDDQVAARWAEHAGHHSKRIPMVLEGGSLTVDGEGTLITTIQCLMNPNRNPGLTKFDIEERLGDELGITTVIWLPYGLADDDDTDGHVDNVAVYARPGVVVMQGCDDPSEPDWLRMGVNQRWARGSSDAAGRMLEVVEIPVLPFVEIGGQRCPVPYGNFYVGNGFVLVPTANHEADADMLAIIGEQFPGREVIGLDVGPILAYGGGGIHCITQQVPAI